MCVKHTRAHARMQARAPVCLIRAGPAGIAQPVKAAARLDRMLWLHARCAGLGGMLLGRSAC
eukprot:354318-Chlamydomonas_euryale.AAC.23